MPSWEEKNLRQSLENGKFFFCNIYPHKINISPSIQVQPVSVDSFSGPSPEYPVTSGTGNRVTRQLVFLFCFVLIFTGLLAAGEEAAK